MNTSSYFIKDKGIFGSYPTQEDIKYFEDLGINFIVNLTTEFDNLEPYTTNCEVLNFPILDRRYPLNVKEFSTLTLKCVELLQNGKKMYIHCKGGHGRSGILVAAILTYYHKISPTESLILTNEYHSQRVEMKERWRKIGSPQTNGQKKFIHKLFNPLYFTRVSNGFKSGLSNLSNNKIIIENQEYENAELAYQSMKLTKLNIITELQPKNIYYFREYAEKKYKISEEEKIEIMTTIINLKYAQNDNIKNNLLNIGIRPIVYSSIKDCFWGIDKNGDGKNYLGTILTKIKNELLINEL
jgi:predicted NAD-dependent protein-ADP-ribosyltransferase YbiA (DUF1768 family)